MLGQQQQQQQQLLLSGAAHRAGVILTPPQQNLQSGVRGTLLSEQPVAPGNQMILPNQVTYQMQPLQRVVPQQMMPAPLPALQPAGPPQQSRFPSAVPPSTSPLPPLPDPATAGFVLKPGTFTSTSSDQKTAATTSAGVAATVLPHTAPVSAKSAAGMSGGSSLVYATPSSLPEVPFPTSLPLEGGFQFSMKPPLTLDPEPPSTAGAETLASLLQTTRVEATTTPSSVSPTSAPSQPSGVATTTISLSFYREKEQGGDQDSSYDALPDFKPIVSLPPLDEISTGEEEETVLFAHRAKLYRFDIAGSAWKERGIGEIKILEHKTTGKTRVLMRRDQILKLCCNHYLSAVMTLTPLQGSNQLAWYTPSDFSDGETKAEKLAVKFKQASVAAEYRRVFEECVEKVKGQKMKTDEVESEGPLSSTTEASLREKFSAPAGSWECDACLLQNNASAGKCVACGAPRAGGRKKTEGAGQSSATAAPLFAGATSPTELKFGGDSKGGGMKSEMPSFGAPVSFTGSAGGGGFKMGGLSLESMAKPKFPGGAPLGSGPSSSGAAAGGGGGFKFGGSLFSTSSASGAEGGGFTFSLGTQASSTEAKTEAGPDKQKSGVKFGDFSFALPPTTSTGPAPVFGGGEGGGGFKFNPPSLPPSSLGSKVGGGSSAQEPEGVLTLEPHPPPENGLDTASLFKISSTDSPKPFQFSLSLDPPKVPAPQPGGKEQKEDLNTSSHEPDIHFEPIVTLPQAVEVSSGEENEETVFAERAKLFRFDSALKQWKERGVGEMKILVNRGAGKARVLMRRDQVLKICCNHVITAEMSLTPMQGNGKAWTWFTPCDFSEEKERPENLSARFKSPAIAGNFKKAFESAVKSAGSAGEGGDTDAEEPVSQTAKKKDGEGVEGGGGREDVGSSAKSQDIAAKFAPSPGSWNCQDCYLTNRNEDRKCCACGRPAPQSPPLSQPHPSLSSASIAPQSQPRQQITFGARLQITPRLTAVAVPTQTDEEPDDHSSASPSPSPSPTAVSFQRERSPEAEGGEDDVVFVAVELPSEEKVKLAESLLLPPSFFNYENQPSCPGCHGCVDLLTGPYESAEAAEVEKEGGEEGKEEKEEKEGEKEGKNGEEKPPVSFGDSHAQFSFSSLAASATGGDDNGGFWGKKTGFSGFTGAGTQLFAAKPPTAEEGGDNPEAEVDINFRPVVTLAEIETKTGEEEEECLFSHRAKLYRFDSTVWKERGVGDIKILRNGSTQRSRVIMRRDQIFKLCCNHLITPDMTLERSASSEKAWMWKTLSDFAYETPREETFTVKFKHREMADRFGEVFRSCQEDVPTQGKPEEIADDQQSPPTPPSQSAENDQSTPPDSPLQLLSAAESPPEDDGPHTPPFPPPDSDETPGEGGEQVKGQGNAPTQLPPFGSVMSSTASSGADFLGEKDAD